MAASVTLFNNFKRGINDDIDWAADTIKLALMKATYAPDIDAQVHWNDVSAQELAAGGGYTAGGTALTTKTVTVDNVNDRAKYDADDVTWAAATFGPTPYGVLYKDTGVAGTSTLIGIVDFGGSQTVTAGTFLVTWNAVGIFTAN